MLNHPVFCPRSMSDEVSLLCLEAPSRGLPAAEVLDLLVFAGCATPSAQTWARKYMKATVITAKGFFFVVVARCKTAHAISFDLSG